MRTADAVSGAKLEGRPATDGKDEKESGASAQQNGKSGMKVEGRSRNRQVEGEGFRTRTNRLTGPDAGA